MKSLTLPHRLLGVVVACILLLGGSRAGNGQVNQQARPTSPVTEDSPRSTTVDSRGQSGPVEAGREWKNGIGMEFVWIPPGEFVMGSRSEHAFDDEVPLTRVRISTGYWLGRHEVTQGQWQGVMGSNPSYFSSCGSDCPVEKVSWEEAQEFIRRLNERSGTGEYRFPTEAEWEYAARAGTRGDTYAGDLTDPSGRDQVLERIAWYGENSEFKTHPVGRRSPNGWGLHDMLGNVWEWVADRYGDYPGGSVTDPMGPETGSNRVARGGSWGNIARRCRSSYRSRDSPGHSNNHLGFRLLRTE